MVSDALLSSLESAGYRARLVPLARLEELRSEWQRLDHSTDVWQTCLAGMAFAAPADLPNAESVLIVASRALAARAWFNVRGERFAAEIPPTYLVDAQVAAVTAAIRAVLEPSGHGWVKGWLPAKLLAVRSGLADYGRNNLAYVPGWGSYARLDTWFTTLPPGAHEWREQARAAACDECSECVASCPTGALSEGSPLVDADRCLTRLNEGDGGFPSWVADEAHNALIGCMRCQGICPMNAGALLGDGPESEFNEEETDLILNPRDGALLPAERLNSLPFSSFGPLGRNLRALVGAKAPAV